MTFKTQNIILFSIGMILLLSTFLFPELAFAEDGTGGFSFTKITDTLQLIVNAFLLPLSILIAGWRIIYIAIFCGIFGMDPFGWVGESAVSNPWDAIKKNLTGFFYGLCGIAGVWIILEVAISVASLLASGLSGIF